MTRASRWVLAAAIAGSALAVGTVHTVTLCIVTALLAVAAVPAWWGAEPMKARSAATLLLFTGIGLTAYTALQCVPMPIGWLAVIAPHNADGLVRRAYERTPDDDGLPENVARLASTTGLHVEAAKDYERLARRRPREARRKTAAAAERASAIQRALNL
jgi:hypothetical protein